MNDIKNSIDRQILSYSEHIPAVKTTTHWWDLYEGHYIGIESSLQRQILSEAIEKAGNISNLARQTGLLRKRVSECAALIHRPTIGFLIKVCDYTGFPKTEIEKNVAHLGRFASFEPNLPFKLHNKEGVEIRAAFLCDGHVPNVPVASPIYSAYEEELHWRLIELSQKIFGRFDTEPKKGHKTPQTRLPPPTGAVLERGGVPRGNKRRNTICVPRDVFMGGNNLKAVYLRKIFDDEGDVCFDKFGKRAVRLTRSSELKDSEMIQKLVPQKWTPIKNNVPPNNLIYGEWLLLKELGIGAKLYNEGVYKSKDKKITNKWRIQITQQDNLKKFAEHINFGLCEKKEKLDQCLNSFKIHQFPNGAGETFSINILQSLLYKRGYFTYGDLGRAFEKIGKCNNLASYHLRSLQEKKLVRKVKRGTYEFTG